MIPPNDPGIISDAGSEDGWYRGDGNDWKAKAAYEALLGVQLYWPSTDAFDEFSKKLKQRTLDNYNYDYGNETVCRTKCQ